MASCLGLYIEENLIKYAKVSKSNEATKIESFGIKFYENLESTIKQIIEETYSFKTPISINLSDEVYNKFEIFSLLSPKDTKSIIKTQFESICYDKDENPNVYEERYIPSSTGIENEKVKIIHISAPKTAIAQGKNLLTSYKVTQIAPIGITITNLLKREKKTTSLIVNIEKNTIITKVYDNMVADVQIIPIGSQNILNNINKKENSYSKSYETCKNVTIYTDKDKDLQYEENEYLVDIMPTLFEIVTEIRNIVEQSFERIDKVYITGTASVINNIDIYFEEYLKGIQCELLKPSFISNNSKLNMKDYIEVNSAISLALQGLEKNSPVNFTKETGLNRTSDILKKEIKLSDINIGNFSKALEKVSGTFNVVFITFTLLVIFYLVGSFIMTKQLNDKIALADKSIDRTNERIKEVNSYNAKFNTQITEYEELIQEIENINNANSENKKFKNTIPNLLNNIMAVIPKNVQLISIENTSGTHIVIGAKSNKYEQIAFFKTKLKTEEILKDVVSDTGVTKDGYLTVTIEGELP